jgi:tRNA threonylcarbamoyl adenosine modification protein YeaZ
MLAVAFETSARPGSVAVGDGDRVVAATLDAERMHARDLLPALDRLFAEVGARASDVRAVIVGTGPGSYTGLRVGIATALGLARAVGAALRGVPSGESAAFAELAPGDEAVILIDARQDEVYFAHYRRTASEVEIVRAPCVLRSGDVAAALPDRVPIFADAAGAEAARLTATQRSRVRIATARAESLLELGVSRIERSGPQAPHEIEPLYLRPFAASQRRR